MIPTWFNVLAIAGVLAIALYGWLAEKSRRLSYGRHLCWRFASRLTYPVLVHFSSAHFNDPDLRPRHGPQLWPWWRLVAFRFGHPHVVAPSTSSRLWIYTRWGAVYVEVDVDRRELWEIRAGGIRQS